jgi:glutamate:Na+ symporter, ESS family
VRTIELNLVYILVLSLLVYFVGQWLVDRVQLLKRFSIPGPVVGGSLVAAALARAAAFLGTRVAFTMTLKDTLLQMFSSPWGPPRTCGCWSGVARACPYSPGWARRLSSLQNAIGLVAARLLDLHPVVGLLGGSITLTGGHGKGAAYSGRFGDRMTSRARWSAHGERHRGPRCRGGRGRAARRVSDPAHRLSASSRPSPP